MILRALEILDHASTHAAKIYLASPRSLADGRAYSLACGIFDKAQQEIERELRNRPLALPIHAVRKFGPRGMAEN